MVKNNKDLLDKAALLASITQTIVLTCLTNIEKFSFAKQVVAFICLT
ncbi:transposase [Orientia tsutsugamushi]|nr:transposase [Orientia tsutsugamushi]